MLAEARTTLQPFADRVTYIQADLLEIDKHVKEPVDVVFSTATFHWIADHERLFGALHAILKPGGRLQIADIVTGVELSEDIRRDIDLWTG